MAIKNKYYKCSRISEAKFREILKYFCADLTASQITYFTGLNRNTINALLNKIRQRIAELSKLQSALLVGQIVGQIEVNIAHTFLPV